jgi:acid stress-induced BolA-like protein IbaG/YrbA
MKSDAQEKVSQHLEKTLKIMEMEVEGNQEKIKGLLQ